jgi:hypothetical protein
MFDTLDLRTDRRLAEAQQLGRLGDAADFGDSHHRAHDLGGNVEVLISSMHRAWSFETGGIRALPRCNWTPQQSHRARHNRRALTAIRFSDQAIETDHLQRLYRSNFECANNFARRAIKLK